MPSDASQILVPFGFTGLESEIYTFLLQESPATGYRVGQALGKAAANVYKAIESLQQKGAVLVEEGSSRLCRAVPPDELLTRLSRDFEWRRAEAELKLANLDTAGGDDRIYTLRSPAQVIERARHMLGSAEIVVLLACAAPLADQLADSLALCSVRNVKTFVAKPETSLLTDIRLVIDGEEFLFGLFSANCEEVVQASWSKSPYLSLCAYRGLAAELAGSIPVSKLPSFIRLAKG